MEDIGEKISMLLNSPDGMEKIRAAAKNILGEAADEPDPPKNDGGISLPENLLNNMGSIQNIMRIMGLLNQRKEDSRVNLLLALKPHLSHERAKRVDKAVSLLRVASLLPLLREEGLLEGLGL